jgi:hypothetical protein
MSIPISAGLRAHLAQPYQTMAPFLKVTLTNGTVLGFTGLDAEYDYDGVTYDSVVGFMPFDVVTGSDLSVDNSEIRGILSSPSITIDDLRAGLWSGARCEFFWLNYMTPADGPIILRVGWLGEVRTGRNSFEAELRGLAQAYTRVVGQLTSPLCRNTLFDAGCQVDPATFTFTDVVVDGVSDNQTIFASALTQDGPASPISITAISKANPGIVTTASPHGFSAGAPINIYLCTGMTMVNGATFARAPLGASTFALGVNTTSYPTYTGGGFVAPLGGTSGYFDNGLLTFNTDPLEGGLNHGLSMEIRMSAPGQVMLQLPMPYAIVGGDKFTIVAGCNKALNTCKVKYDNVINFNGEPYLPGLDKVIQVNKEIAGAAS